MTFRGRLFMLSVALLASTVACRGRESEPDVTNSSTQASDEIPGSFPDDLVPPQVSEIVSMKRSSGFEVRFVTGVSFEDLVSFYTDRMQRYEVLVNSEFNLGPENKTRTWLARHGRFSLEVEAYLTGGEVGVTVSAD